MELLQENSGNGID